MSDSSQLPKSAEQQHVEALITKQLSGNSIYGFLLSDARVISAIKGHVVCRLPMSRNHMNSKAGIHGSVSATIVDCK